MSAIPTSPMTGAVIAQVIRYMPGFYCLGLILHLFRSLLPLAPGLLIKFIFDHLTTNATLGWNFWSLIALLVGMAMIRVTALLLSVSLDSTTIVTGWALMRHNVISLLFKRPGASPLPTPPGDMINRLNTDTTNIMNHIGYSLMVIGSGVQAIAAIAIMMSIDPLITMVGFVPMLAASYLINLATQKIQRFHTVSRDAVGAVSSFISEAFSAVQVIQVAGAQESVLRRFKELNDTRRKTALQDRLFTDVFLSSIWENTSKLGTGVILLLAANAIRSGSFSVGDLALFISYLGWVTDFTSLFSQNLALHKQAGVSIGRLAELLPATTPTTAIVAHHPLYLRANAAPPADPAAIAADPLNIVEAQGLSYHYPDSTNGIENISLTINRGQLIVVTGPVGSGKTTLLRTFLGLLPLDSGTIRWNGQDIEDPTSFFRPRRSAYTPQAPHLFSGSLQDNILMGNAADDATLRMAIHTAIFEDDLASMEEGLETLIGTRGMRLSGGQMHRVAAARMFSRQPELLVFDDLSSALDVKTEQKLWERLFDQGEATYLVVSHKRAVLQRADHIIVLSDGKIESEGSLDRLLKTSRQLQAIWREATN